MTSPLSLLRSSRGAFDLPSIITGVVVVGILTAGVFASVFGIIPYAQDEGAKQDLVAVRTAEGTHLAVKGAFRDAAGLADAKYLPRAGNLDVSVNDKGTCYVGVARSGSGKVYYSTNASNSPQELTPATVMDGRFPGCLNASENSKLVDNVGGFKDEFFTPIGSGTGSDTDPGVAVKVPASAADPSAAGGTAAPTPGSSAAQDANAGTDPSTATAVTEMTVYGSDVELVFRNTGSSNYRFPYTITASCRDRLTGAVTVERINGYYDLQGNMVSTLSLIACMSGTDLIDVSAPTYDWDGNVWRWRTYYTYTYSEPVARGVTASGQYSGSSSWCIENRANAATAGNPVDLEPCADVDGQRWQWNGDGRFVQSTLVNKCMTAAPTRMLILGDCDGSDAQHFTAEPLDKAGLVRIIVRSTGECVDVPGGVQARVQLATSPCNGSPLQGWYVPGVGIGGDTVQPQEAPPAVTVTSLGTVSGPSIADSGKTLKFTMSIGSYSTNKPTSTHVTLTCMRPDETTYQLNELRTIVSTSLSGTGNITKSASCTASQVIGYTVKPVTSAGLRMVTNPEEFKGWSPAQTLAWNAADGYPVVGSAGGPLVTNSGSDLEYTVTIGSYKANLATSTHYRLVCMAPDLSSYIVDGVTTAMTTSISGGTYPQKVTCGNGQIIEYTTEPLTLDGLKAASNPGDAGGYTTSGAFHWNAEDGYPVIGTASNPVIGNAGKDFSYRVTIGSYQSKKATSSHYVVTCRDTAGNNRVLNDTSTFITYSNSGDVFSKTVTCGADQVVAYSVKPLTLAGLKETATPMSAGGYTTSGTFSWTKP